MNSAREDRVYGQPEYMTQSEYRTYLRNHAPDMVTRLRQAREDGDWRAVFTLEFLLDWIVENG